MADPVPSDPIRTMLKAEAHAALRALAEVGQVDMSGATLARRLDALGSAWGNARRGAVWSTGMERGLDTLVTSLREAHGLAAGAGMPPSELGARVAVVLADKTHPERPALLKAFAGALNAGHVVMKPPKTAATPAKTTWAWSELNPIEGFRCSVCMGPVRMPPSGPASVCEKGHSDTEELDPNADRPALRP